MGEKNKTPNTWNVRRGIPWNLMGTQKQVEW
jgi:hypothetical protein